MLARKLIWPRKSMLWFTYFIIANITSRWEIWWLAEIVPRKLCPLNGVELHYLINHNGGDLERVLLIRNYVNMSFNCVLHLLIYRITTKMITLKHVSKCILSVVHDHHWTYIYCSSISSTIYEYGFSKSAWLRWFCKIEVINYRYYG